jgi:hypothetical protein
MPWTPDPTQLNSLKVQINQKWRDPALNSKDVNDCITALKFAMNKKQAEAVLAAVSTVAQLKKLNAAWYEKLANNQPATIKAALNPEAVRIAGLSDEQINGYLRVVSMNRNFSNHRSGTDITLPLKDGHTEIAVFYNNAQGKLPAGGEYVEWYASAGGSQRSRDKRFFTKKGDRSNLWYTEGGTHVGAQRQEWWRRTSDNRTWQSF